MVDTARNKRMLGGWENEKNIWDWNRVTELSLNTLV